MLTAEGLTERRKVLQLMPEGVDAETGAFFCPNRNALFISGNALT